MTRSNHHATLQAPHRATGFSLLEVLVTLVVVSIGILGILGMQTASMINTRISASRSNATVAADNFAARMRANPDVNYDGIASDASITNPTSATKSKLPDCSASSSNSCDEDDIKAIAVWEWSKTLQRTLPNGRGFVDCLNATAGTGCERYRITVVWDEHDPLRYDNNTQGTGSADFCDNDPPDRT